jgi:hypothetical protein
MNAKCVQTLGLVLALSIGGLTQQASTAPASPTQAESTVFTVNDANEILSQFRESLAAHSQKKLFALLDADRMQAYHSFQDQMKSYFSRYETIRVNVHSIQASGENERGVITATFEVEITPRYGSAVRKQAQLRFQLERSDKGWLIVDINPRSFFS